MCKYTMLSSLPKQPLFCLPIYFLCLIQLLSVTKRLILNPFNILWLLMRGLRAPPPKKKRKKEGILSDSMLLYNICYMQKSAKNLKIWARFHDLKILWNQGSVLDLKMQDWKPASLFLPSSVKPKPQLCWDLALFSAFLSHPLTRPRKSCLA